MQKTLTLLLLAFLFTGLGWILHAGFQTSVLEQDAPLITGRIVGIPTPQDHLSEEYIKVYKNKVVLNISNAEWSTLTDTHSMEPTLAKDTNAIEIIPKDPDQLHVGDIVAYKSKLHKATILHRIIEKGTDQEGVYFILKGDNNKEPDLERVRFEQIERLVVAIIY